MEPSPFLTQRSPKAPFELTSELPLAAFELTWSDQTLCGWNGNGSNMLLAQLGWWNVQFGHEGNSGCWHLWQFALPLHYTTLLTMNQKSLVSRNTKTQPDAHFGPGRNHMPYVWQPLVNWLKQHLDLRRRSLKCREHELNRAANSSDEWPSANMRERLGEISSSCYS